jgi:hypothetical protein
MASTEQAIRLRANPTREANPGTILSIKGIDFTVAYVDTNYHARQCGGNNQCDAKAIFTVGAQF